MRGPVGGPTRRLGKELERGLSGGHDVVAGRYALIDPIASGGSGTVWRAYDHDLDQWCAAKVMRQRHAGELLRFVREQSVRLQHPHIASPYAWSADDGTVLIASELVNGGSLHTLIGDYGPLEEATVVVLLDQVLSALCAMHEAGLVHRDVTPGNILLRATGTGPLHCLLTDFGLTIGLDDPRLTQTGMVIGTPGYLPPEVMLGTASPHPNHDVYAVGQLALTLALGLEPPTVSWPQPGRDPFGSAAHVVDERLDRLVDPQLQGAVRLMTAAEPARRPPDARAALRLIAGVPRAASPHTVDGDSVTVFNQFTTPATDPCLVGASADGSLDVPVGTPEETDGKTTSRRLRSTAPAPGGGDDEPYPTVTASTPSPLPPDVGSRTEPPRSLVRRRPRPRSVGAVTALLIAVVGAAVAAANGVGPFGDSPSPAGRTVPIVRPAGDGQACGWQQQGDVIEATDGQVTCRLVDGNYVWGP